MRRSEGDGTPSGQEAGRDILDPSAVEPATVFEAAQFINLAEFPLAEGIEDAYRDTTRLYYSGLGDVFGIRLFYEERLRAAGWKELGDPRSLEDHTRRFEKSGFQLDLTVAGLDDGEVMVSITNRGNYRPEWLPRYGDAELTGSDSAIYASPASIVELETFLYREMARRGWHACSRLDGNRHEEPDVRSLSFVKRGVIADIGIRRHWSDSAKYVVTPATQLLDGALPVPAKTPWIEVAPAVRKLVLLSGEKLAVVSDFYRAEMPKEGWRTLGDGGPTNRSASLAFERMDDVVRIGMVATDAGTLVTVGEPAKDQSWILQVEGNAARTVMHADGIEVADFPLPEDASQISRDRDGRRMEFRTALAPDAAARFYIGRLRTLGWTASDNNQVGSEFARVKWVKGEADLRFGVNRSGRVVFSGTGLLFNKSIPEDAVVVSYATWLRRNGYPPTLDRLDAYRSAMEVLQP